MGLDVEDISSYTNYSDDEGIDNSHIRYTNKMLYLKLNDKKERRNRLEKVSCFLACMRR